MFSPISVVVILVFVGVCAAIACPGYIKFQPKAKQSEAKTNLGAIFTTQVAYYGEHGAYASKFSELRWEPVGETRYAYFLANDVIQSIKGGPFNLPPEVAAAIGEDSFTVVAVGNIDRDDSLDVWTMNDGKVLKNVANDVSN